MIGKISKVTEITDGVKKFEIELPERLGYEPGQYVLLSLPFSDEKRAYSIVSSDEKSIKVIIKKQGEFTSKLFSENPGKTINVSGPYGRFVLPEKDAPLVFVAGGIGITPLYSMLAKFMQSRKSTLCLFYSSKKREETVLYEELSKIDDKRVRVNFCFTREGGDRICYDTLAKADNFQDSLFYICGPRQMVDSLRDELIKNSVDESRIRSEDFHK